MNIIIPLGGLGDRFRKEGYQMPKPLIKILGKEMILHVLDNLKLTMNDKIHIIYNMELDGYQFKDFIGSKYTVNMVKLNKQTEGACETILYGLNTFSFSDLQNKTVLLDGDTFYMIDILSMYRNETENAVVCFIDEQEKPLFSYVKVRENNLISEIREKVKISPYANTGCYCFKNGSILKEYCEKIITKDVRQNGEYYTSCVIDMMLKDEYLFRAITIKNSDFKCVGTPLQLKLYCAEEKEKPPLRISYDLDSTLVSHPTIPGDYSTVEPIQRNIDYLNHLKREGHYIIIYTARRMKTHHGNVGKIVKDVGKITLQTLDKFGIQYDELVFGKPYADFYIDDKALNINQDLEKELGIYVNKVEERTFNQISSCTMEIIIKKGERDKIQGEIFWYKNIPPKVEHFFPAFIRAGEAEYSIEKIQGIPLSYIFTKESMNVEMLQNYLLALKTIHESRECSEQVDLNANYSAKIRERYNSNRDLYDKFEHSLEVYTTLLNFFDTYNGTMGVIHGDPVFSNCIVTRDMQFKFIDMRGKLGNVYSIFGDIFYDYAKIYQSLIGYDEIMLEKRTHISYKENLYRTFEEFIVEHFGITAMKNIRMITNSLLFTLLPLHNNEKCYDYFSLIRF